MAEQGRSVVSKHIISSPQVTVLMGVFNGAAYLRNAVDSILAQTFRDFEFIIINDGSTDDSRAILNSYDDRRIRVIENEENIGLTRSLNKGLILARAELIARQDADDISHPTRLEKQVVFMSMNPEAVMVGTQARYINARGRIRVSRLWWKATTLDGIRFQSLFDSPFFHTSVVFRRKIILDILGGYSELYWSSQDFELWSRLLVDFNAANLSETLVDQRSHSGAVSNSYSSTNAHRVEQIFQKNLESVFGINYTILQWPSAWIAATNPNLGEPYSHNDLLNAVGNIYYSFINQRVLSEGARAEVDLQYSAKIMLIARLCSPKHKLFGLLTALKTLFICPTLAARELPRLVASIMLGK